MTRQHVSRTNQQSKSDTPLVSGILQRAAVRNVPEKDVQPTSEEETTTFRESGFHHNFCQVPVSTGEMPMIQPKLRIGAVEDRYEQEADRVAQDVVQRINAPAPKTGDKDELRMKPMVQRLSDGGGMAAPPDLDTSIQGARGGGQPLADSVIEPMERAFGTDFSGVRVHTDAKSDELNQSIHAKAFTTGQDIFFRQSTYQPESRGGQKLIAHELTHVVQQNGGVVQRTLDGRAGADKQDFRKGLYHGTYYKTENTADLHVDNATSEEEHATKEELRVLLKDIYQAMVTNHGVTRTVGKLEWHPTGAVVVKQVIELLGNAAGTWTGWWRARQATSQRKKAMEGQKKPDRMAQEMNSAMIPEHIAYMKALQGQAGIKVRARLSDNSDYQAWFKANPTATEEQKRAKLEQLANLAQANMLEDNGLGKQRLGAYEASLQAGMPASLDIEIVHTQLPAIIRKLG